MVAGRDYSTARVGAIEAILQVRGTGPDPVVSPADYIGANDAIFTVEVTTGGTVTNAIYKWKKDSGSYTSGVTTAATAQSLQDGVQIYWPGTVTYVSGDVFIVRTAAINAPGLPRYELWPHKKAEYSYPYLYVGSPADLEDSGAVIPYNIRGDVLLEYALAASARWPGLAGEPSPYFNLKLAGYHDSRATKMTQELELTDDEIFNQDLTYVENLPLAPVPWGDAAQLQKHAL